VSPRTRAALAEAAISLVTMAVFLGVVRYGPDLATAARLLVSRRRPAALAEDELAVSDFRMGLGGPVRPDQWTAENWGWDE
jgi:hypothetical protein